MPIKQSYSTRTKTKVRTLYAQARAAAQKKFGKKAMKNKIVHHKDGNFKHNGPANLSLITSKTHGKKHGRGNGRKIYAKQGGI